MSHTLILYNNNNNLVSMNSIINYDIDKEYCYFGKMF
ncbi:CRPV-122 [Crowpox virus]|nr:CRPV-122 [Crowpox virus]